MTIRGALPVMVTPMGADQSVDFAGLCHNIDFYLQKGAQGIIALGSTGEFASLSRDERKQIAEATVQHVDGRVPVVVGTAAEATSDAVEYSIHAEEIGADAVMLLPSFYCNPTQDEIFEHFAAVSKSIDLPIMIYNNPWTTGVDISKETVLRLARQFSNISYIKESTGDIRRLRDILIEADEHITVFCGADDLAYESLMLGASGWVSMAGNIVPDLITELFAAIADKGQWQKGWEIYQSILPLCKLLEDTGKPVQMIKAAMDHMGQSGGSCRNPRKPLSSDEKKQILKTIEPIT